MRIALTGGIACGKSLVALYLNELGVETIDAGNAVNHGDDLELDNWALTLA